MPNNDTGPVKNGDNTTDLVFNGPNPQPEVAAQPTSKAMGQDSEITKNYTRDPNSGQDLYSTKAGQQVRPLDWLKDYEH